MDGFEQCLAGLLELVRRLVDADRAEALKTESQQHRSLTLTQRQVCDLELLMNGALQQSRTAVAGHEVVGFAGDEALPPWIVYGGGEDYRREDT